MSVIDNVKGLKAWVMGAIAFDAAVTTLLINIFEVDAVKTTIATTATTIVALIIIWLIYKSEENAHKELQEHIEQSNILQEQLKECMVDNKQQLLDIRKDTLRIQLSQYMKDQPENIDTILKLAETYFVQLKGDWYMTSEFSKWADSQGIKVPSIIQKSIIDIEK